MTVADAPTPGTPPAPDRRHRRWEATHEAIRRAALELVAAHGLDAVSVEMIAERADVGYRTFFNHFADKVDALVEPVTGRLERVIAGLAARPREEPPLSALRAAILAEVDDSDGRRRGLGAKIAVIEANPELRPRFHEQFVAMERAIVDALASRTGMDPQRELYPHVTAAAAGAALRTAFVRWRADGGTATIRPYVEEAFALLENGLVPRPSAAGRAATPPDPVSAPAGPAATPPDPGGTSATRRRRAPVRHRDSPA